MELQNNNNNITNHFIKPSELISQIAKIEESMPHILDDFKNNFILYNKNTQSNENGQMYESIKSNVENENSKLFILNNSMEKGIEDLNSKLLELNKKIQIEKKENQIMKRNLGSIENEYNGSDELIDNYKEMYNMYYFKNFTMIFGIIMASIILTKVFVK
jgi:predicted RNase H-like nuclease (RuvC/YqgF family)